MDNQDIKNAKGRRSLAREIASRATDPHFYAALEWLPNPDKILQKLGKKQEVFDDLVGDAHILGELRAIRAALLGFEWRLMPGGDDPASQRALELCETYMAQQPAAGMQWSDVIWAMGGAVFRGFSVHEVVWARHDRLLMPVNVIDRPQRRFVFGRENDLRLRTREAMTAGIELGPKKWLVSRHMHSYDNPYGVAVFSACFWPHIFKHSGFKFFAKFTEKYGIPWAIGKYPRGTKREDQDALADALAGMVEDAVAAIPDDGKVELLEHSSTGQLPQERLIDVCNRELSKALTSQTLTTEIQGQGSRAASQTHREKEVSVNQSDRAIIEYTMNDLLRWITELNVQGATPPRFEFYEEAEANKEMAEFISEARKHVPLSKREVYERLQLTAPDDDDDTIPVSAGTPSQMQPPAPPSNFSACPHCGGHHFAQGQDPEADLVHQATELGDTHIEALTDAIAELLDGAKDLKDFRRRLTRAYPNLDDQGLTTFINKPCRPVSCRAWTMSITNRRSHQMDNQHKKITGYRDLNQDEIDLMNEGKALAELCRAYVQKLARNEQTDWRWVDIGRTNLQTGFMALIRSIAKPTSF